MRFRGREDSDGKCIGQCQWLETARRGIASGLPLSRVETNSGAIESARITLVANFRRDQTMLLVRSILSKSVY